MITSGSEASQYDYPPITELTKGAIWDITKLRTSSTAAAFADAFIKGKVKEIEETPTTTSPPATTGSYTSGSPSSSISGDPHVRLWNGHMFDFHGGKINERTYSTLHSNWTVPLTSPIHLPPAKKAATLSCSAAQNSSMDRDLTSTSEPRSRLGGATLTQLFSALEVTPLKSREA